MPTPSSAPKRIILTGASGVGKTSLVETIAAKLGIPVIPELGREICRSMGYQRIGEIPDQEAFKQSVLEAQIGAEEKHGDFVADRSTIDCWVLWQRWNICSAMTYDTEHYYKLARAQSRTYTKIIYIPPMFPPQEDGFRWTDKDYQQQIDRLVRMTLYEWQLLERTYVVQMEGVERRQKEVLEWLTNC